MLNHQKKDPQRQESAGRVEIPAELVAEAKAGDQAAFTELFDLTHRAIYRTIRSMVRDEDLVWDIHQDTYLRAFKGLEKLENEASFFPWLRRIAVNVTAKTMAKRVPLPFSELGGEEDAAPELPDPNPETQPELALDRKETSRMVREILSGLPEAQQMIVGMRYYEEMRVDEIAELLGLTPGTVKTQLYRGRRRIEAAVRELGKQDVRLYGLSPLPVLLALLRRLEPVEAAEKKAVVALTESGFRNTAVHTGRRFFETAAGRVLLGLITVGVIGGGVAGFLWLQSRAEPLGDVRPPVIRMASPEDMSSEPVTTAQETTETTTTEPSAEPTGSETTAEPAPETEGAPNTEAPSPAPLQPTQPRPTEPKPTEVPTEPAELPAYQGNVTASFNKQQPAWTCTCTIRGEDRLYTRVIYPSGSGSSLSIEKTYVGNNELILSVFPNELGTHVIYVSWDEIHWQKLLTITVEEAALPPIQEDSPSNLRQDGTP